MLIQFQGKSKHPKLTEIWVKLQPKLEHFLIKKQKQKQVYLS